MSKPNNTYIKVLNRIQGYLNKYPDFSLKIKKGLKITENRILIYIDLDYTSNLDNRKSIKAYINLFKGNIISQATKK